MSVIIKRIKNLSQIANPLAVDWITKAAKPPWSPTALCMQISFWAIIKGSNLSIINTRGVLSKGSFNRTTSTQGSGVGRGLNRNFQGSTSFGRGRGQQRMSKEERPKLICEHCSFNGHEVKECFKLHGYPDWYKELKDQKNNRSINMVEGGGLPSSNYKGEEDQRKVELPYFASLIQKEIAKYMSSHTSVTHSGDTHSFSHFVDYSGNTHQFALSLLHDLGRDSWIIDTGASRHICASPSLVEEGTDSTIVDDSSTKSPVGAPLGRGHRLKKKPTWLNDYVTTCIQTGNITQTQTGCLKPTPHNLDCFPFTHDPNLMTSNQTRKKIIPNEDETVGELPSNGENPDARGLNSLILVRTVLGKRTVSWQAFQNVVSAMWSPVHGVIVKKLDNNRYLFVFKHPRDRKRALMEGPWTFDKFLIVLAEVGENDSPDSVALEWSEFPIQIQWLPMNKITHTVVAHLGNKIRKFISADIEDGMYDSTLRIRVSIDVNKPLKRVLQVAREGTEPLILKLGYEGLPNICYECGLLGHILKECLK
ncbi:hypothetical protein DH2020_000491 [Rehmannia glutinosa]|uniref:CCHC-type domain-containing protein n=1 Tax=Rehmannia glutinosa TaxID=99300 RepID=A0ABR0XWN0_REHGL